MASITAGQPTSGNKNVGNLLVDCAHGLPSPSTLWLPIWLMGHMWNALNSKHSLLYLRSLAPCTKNWKIYHSHITKISKKKIWFNSYISYEMCNTYSLVNIFGGRCINLIICDIYKVTKLFTNHRIFIHLTTRTCYLMICNHWLTHK